MYILLYIDSRHLWTDSLPVSSCTFSLSCMSLSRSSSSQLRSRVCFNNVYQQTSTGIKKKSSALNDAVVKVRKDFEVDDKPHIAADVRSGHCNSVNRCPCVRACVHCIHTSSCVCCCEGWAGFHFRCSAVPVLTLFVFPLCPAGARPALL